MSNEKWTEGDWRVVKKDQPVGWAEYEIAWSDIGELVCDVVYEEADAHLMAASKKLYGALKDAMRSARKDFPPGEEGERMFREAYAEQMEALAAARGE